MLAHCREITSHRYFSLKPADEVDVMLNEEKKARPQLIPYKLSFDRQRPGVFLLQYQPSASKTKPPRREVQFGRGE